jgi:hypothetical protein
MISLLKATIHLYIWTGIILFSALPFFCNDIISYYNFINILLFISYVIILWCSIGKNDEYYSYGRLGITVFCYSIIFVFMLLDASVYYSGDTFFWDYTDPYAYAQVARVIVDTETPFFDQPALIQKLWTWWDFQDWGASMTQSLFLNLIQSRYFLFISQTAVGAVGAMLMFGFGKEIMRPGYAYMAALSYSISSFSIFYYSSFRKEIFMVFIVISSFWAFYRYLTSKKSVFLILAFIITFLMIFFRGAVAGLMLIGMMSYFGGRKLNKDNARPVVFAVLAVLAVASPVLLAKLSSFADDLSRNENYVDTTPFGIVTSTVGVLIGPFPQLLQLGVTKMSQLPWYGPGLLLKFLLALAFWNGFVLCLKKWEVTILPLFVFTTFEMLALAIMNDGLELRKAMPHISTFYMAAFWFISKYDERVEKEQCVPTLYPLPKAKPERVLFGTALFVIFASFVWNTMR